MGEFDLVFITNRYYKDILHDVGHIRRWEATGANVKVLVLGEDAHNGSRLNPNPGERVEVENLEDRLKEINADLNIWYRLDTKDKIDPDASQYGTFQYIPVALRLMSNMLEKTMVVSNLGLTERLAELYETKDKFLSVEDYFDWSEDVILEKRNTHLGKITAKKASIRLFVKEDPEGAQHHIWTPSGLHELTPHRYQLLKHIVENGILEIDDLIAFPDVKELFGDIGRAWVLEKLNITLKAIDPDRKYLRSLEGIRGKTHKYWFYCGNIQNYKINNEKFRDIEFDRELGWITIQSGNNYKYGVLTQSELALLSLLIDNAGIPLSFQTILKKLKYGSKSESAIRDLFSNLEKKIEIEPNNPKYIFKVHVGNQRGYYLKPDIDPNDIQIHKDGLTINCIANQVFVPRNIMQPKTEYLNDNEMKFLKILSDSPGKFYGKHTLSGYFDYSERALVDTYNSLVLKIEEDPDKPKYVHRIKEKSYPGYHFGPLKADANANGTFGDIVFSPEGLVFHGDQYCYLQPNMYSLLVGLANHSLKQKFLSMDTIEKTKGWARSGIRMYMSSINANLKRIGSIVRVDSVKEDSLTVGYKLRIHS